MASASGAGLSPFPPWAQLSDGRTTGGDTAELGKVKYKTFFVFRCDRGLLSRESQAFFFMKKLNLI